MLEELPAEIDHEKPSPPANPEQRRNPRRVLAGRANRMKWGGISPEGLERLRQAALQNRPWRFSTGPKTAAGKAIVARNGKVRQKGPISVREARAIARDVRTLIRTTRAARRSGLEITGRDAIGSEPSVVRLTSVEQCGPEE